jgi:hypothetical protein
MSTGPEPAAHQTIEDLERLLANLVDIDPEALREEELQETLAMLDTLEGKTIRRATYERNRIVVETSDGNRYFFYGFIGGGEPSA